MTRKYDRVRLTVWTLILLFVITFWSAVAYSVWRLFQ